ncbi:helix-turn-helix domain-containing protein, partial [Streptomyces sp. NPDC002573]|uniref:helix-turn-helix domain-containing protein n=1 Tax=Streptomyces sp. NPDC002573 TaxID=3364651 RepID=UPI0036CAC617
MRYADGGGLTAKGRQRREGVRLEAVGLFAEGVRPPEVARRLQISPKSVYQWQKHIYWRSASVGKARFWHVCSSPGRTAASPLVRTQAT